MLGFHVRVTSWCPVIEEACVAGTPAAGREEGSRRAVPETLRRLWRPEAVLLQLSLSRIARERIPDT